MMAMLQKNYSKNLLPFLISLGLVFFSFTGVQEYQNHFAFKINAQKELNELFFELGNAPNAIVAQAVEEDLYVKIMSAPNQYLNGLIVVAKNFESENDIQSALKIYLKIIEISPQFSGAYSSAGAIYFQMNDYENAKIMLEAAIRFEPRNYSALSGLGTIEMQNQNYNKAMNYFKNAIAINPYDEIAKRAILNIENKTKGIEM